MIWGIPGDENLVRMSWSGRLQKRFQKLEKFGSFFSGGREEKFVSSGEVAMPPLIKLNPASSRYTRVKFYW